MLEYTQLQCKTPVWGIKKETAFSSVRLQSGKGALSARWGVGIAYQGEGEHRREKGRHLESVPQNFTKTFSPSHLQSLKFLSALPLIPRKWAPWSAPSLFPAFFFLLIFPALQLHPKFVPSVYQPLLSPLTTNFFVEKSQTWKTAKSCPL